MLVVALATALSLLLADGVLAWLGLPRRDAQFRFATPDRKVGEVFLDYGTGLVPDPELFWRLGPDAPLQHVNRLGLRGWWPRRDKGPRDLRIACVGDSCTFGVGVRYEDTFGVRLERALQERLPDRCVESVLAALPGYSTVQDRVLWNRHVAALHPDLTVLYVGAWNDWTAAVGASDSARLRPPTWRLGALVRGLLHGRWSTDDYVAAFRRGEAPDGRRVPLPEFEQQVDALIAGARAAGSAVVVVVPPLPVRTVQQYPISRDYRATVRQVAERNGVPAIDGDAAVQSLGDAAFSDWVHPSAAGHRALAEALLEEAARIAWPPVPPASPPQLGVPEPSRLAALATATVTVPAPDLQAFDRLWIGRRWLDHAALHDGVLEVPVGLPLPVGAQPIEVVGRFGSARSRMPLQVTAPGAPSLQVSVQRDGDGVTVRARGPAPAGCLVAVWLSPTRRDADDARPTQYGPWWLPAPEVGADRDSLAFDAIGLPRMLGNSGGDGTFTVEHRFATAAIADGAMWAQGLVADQFDPGLAVTTEVTKVTELER